MSELHADMSLLDILKVNPKAKEILFDFGILIDIDRIEQHESLGEICAAHHLSERKVEELIKKLNVLPA